MVPHRLEPHELLAAGLELLPRVDRDLEELLALGDRLGLLLDLVEQAALLVDELVRVVRADRRGEGRVLVEVLR